MNVINPSDDKRHAFPPPGFFMFLAATITVVALVAMYAAGVGENTPANYGQGALWMAGAVVPAWLAFFWFDQGHDLHGAAAFTLAIGLAAYGLVVML